MASYCPKCNYKLKITDWRPECPKCGVNVVYYGIEDRLNAEADKAEYEHAMFQPKVDRIKSSFVGDNIAKIRIALCILPVLATLLSMGSITMNVPFKETVEIGWVSIINVVTLFTEYGFDINAIFAALSYEPTRVAFIGFALALVGLALAVVTWLVGIIMLTLSCSPKGIQRNVTIASLGIGFSVISFVGSVIMAGSMAEVFPGIFSASVSPLAMIGFIVTYGAVIAINIINKKKGITINYKDVSEYLIPYEERQARKQEAEAAKAEA
ncbi:MAG: hypothetical protein IKM24_06750 [Clostridia bacterium]|nr:hypothetical protein [Clostridia bacterium]